ncbi:MAG: hypothetical protein LBR71_04215, partial [Synergistaceae bacterium]|nr:hypothetical protein [Synergistaceae bacterium]
HKSKRTKRAGLEREFLPGLPSRLRGPGEPGESENAIAERIASSPPMPKGQRPRGRRLVYRDGKAGSAPICFMRLQQGAKTVDIIWRKVIKTLLMDKLQVL